MLGIMKKNLYSVRVSTIIFIVICVVVIAAPALLSRIEVLRKSPIIGTFPVFLSFFPIVAAGLSSDIVATDKQSGFAVFQRTLPISPEKIVISNLLFAAIYSVMTAVPVIIADIIYAVTGLFEFNPNNLLFLAAIVLLSIISFALGYAAFLRTGNVITSLLGMLVIMLGGIIPVMIYCGDVTLNGFMSKFTELLEDLKAYAPIYFGAIIIIGAVLLLVSYKVAVSAVKRADLTLKGVSL